LVDEACVILRTVIDPDPANNLLLVDQYQNPNQSNEEVRTLHTLGAGGASLAFTIPEYILTDLAWSVGDTVPVLLYTKGSFPFLVVGPKVDFTDRINEAIDRVKAREEAAQEGGAQASGARAAR